MNGINPQLDENVIAKEGNFVAVQKKLVEYLRAIAAFHSVEQIFYEDKLDLVREIEKALSAGVLSMCASIGNADDALPDTAGLLLLDPMDVVVRILENPEINRSEQGTDISALRAAEIIAATLKLEQVGSGFLTKPRIRLAPVPKDASLVGREVWFTLTATIAAEETG